MTAREIKDRAVEHVQEHKAVYIGVGTGVALVAAFTAGALVGRTDTEVAQKIQQIAVGWRIKQIAFNFTERSTPSKPLHLVGTHQYFDSVNDAARKTGHSVTKISRNINGHIPDVGGDIFEVVRATASQE
jgi:hypothetical protein